IPWLFLVFVASPVSNVVFVLERQRGELLFQAGILAVRVGTLVAGWLLDSRLIAIAAFGVGSFLCWASYLTWLLKITACKISAVLGSLLAESAVALVLLTPIVLVIALGLSDLSLVGMIAFSSILAVIRIALE